MEHQAKSNHFCPTSFWKMQILKTQSVNIIFWKNKMMNIDSLTFKQLKTSWFENQKAAHRNFEFKHASCEGSIIHVSHARGYSSNYTHLSCERTYNTHLSFEEVTYLIIEMFPAMDIYFYSRMLGFSPGSGCRG